MQGMIEKLNGVIDVAESSAINSFRFIFSSVIPKYIVTKPGVHRHNLLPAIERFS